MLVELAVLFLPGLGPTLGELVCVYSTGDLDRQEEHVIQYLGWGDSVCEAVLVSCHN